MPKLTQVGTATHGEVTRLAATKINKGGVGTGPSQLAVTAACNGEGKLEVLVWSVANNGTPSVASSRTEGVASEVGVAAIGNLRFVVAVRDAAGELRLILYSLAENGKTISRLDTGIGSKVRDLAITTLGDDKVTVASLLVDRRVEVSTWGISGNTIGSPIVPPVGSGKSTVLDVKGSNGAFCLASRTESATLRLRAYKGPDAPAGDGTGGKVRALSIISGGSAGPYYVGTITQDNASVRTGLHGSAGRLILDTGLLKVAQWEFKDGTFLSPLVQVASGTLDGMAGIAWELKLLNLGVSSVFISAAKGADTYETLLEKNRGKPKMRVMAWERQGDSIERIAQGNAMGKHSLIALAELAKPDATGRVMTAARDGRGKLKVAVWDLTE